MPKRVSIRQKRKEAPDWVFSWRRPGSPVIAKWLAVMVTGCVFAFFMTFLRIRVSLPAAWAAPRASVICVPDDAVGRALSQRAREGGPFPSRFLPSRWAHDNGMEQALLDAARWMPPPYVPSLRKLPREASPPPQLAARGEPVLPERHLPALDQPSPVELSPVPVIHPLSGIRPSEIPTALPPLDGPVDTSESGRFLVQLDADGHVLDCVSMAGGDESGPSPMEKWLRRVTFQPEPGKASRWIGVSVGFTNQPVNDGTDTH